MDRFSSMNWNDIQAFLAVAREKTLRAAARELEVNHATVTRRLTSLEQALGVKLFVREPEGYALSQAGEDLLGSAERIEDECLAIQRKAAGRDAEPRGLVRVSIPPAMVHSFLAQVLMAFIGQYPQIELGVEASHEFSNLPRGQAEVAIRMADEVAGDLVGRRLVRYHKAIYLSRSYLATVDPQKGPEPHKHSWIGWGEDLPYPSWTGDTPFPTLPVRHRLFSNALQVEAAKAGLGLALLPCFLGDAEERLVRMPGTGSKADKSIWILFHPDFRQSARIRAFVDFLVEAVKKHRPLIQGEKKVSG